MSSNPQTGDSAPGGLTAALGAFWSRERKHHLDKMSLNELVVAYFQYPAVQAYIALLLVAGGLTAFWIDSASALPVSLSVLAALLAYPLAWYLLHRFVLHSRFLYRSPRTAKLWKRIHYDHHQDPNDLRVLFGALHTTLPTILLVTVPAGALIAGAAGAAAAFAAGLASTLFYEFCHCIQHLKYWPRSPWLQRVKRLHLMHHFRNENGNYGITNFFWDRVAGTFYGTPEAMTRSDTVHNLGYGDRESARYPWVSRLSESAD